MLWIDVELAWGLVHRRKIDTEKVTNTSIKVREILNKVLDLIEKHRVPVTWAILGHLLLDYCGRDSANKLPHSEMPRPHYSWLKEDWYRYDPCTDVSQDPAWYGKDLTDRIVNYVKQSRLPHDIGCHSFSHQMFGDSGCGEELARAEIKKCVELMKGEYGIVPRVISFPRDYVGHLDALKEYGFVAFRDVPPKLYPCLGLERTISNLVKTYGSFFLQFLSYYLFFPPHVVSPRKDGSGLLAVPGCLAYGKKPLIPMRLVSAKAKQGVNRAIHEKKIFSMYTHLNSFGQDNNILSGFEEFLSYVDEKRREGKLEVRTITELVRNLLLEEV